jgi:hypothetical protein
MVPLLDAPQYATERTDLGKPWRSGMRPTFKHDKPAQVMRRPTTLLPRGATLQLSAIPHFTHVEHHSWREVSEPLTSPALVSQ